MERSQQPRSLHTATLLADVQADLQVLFTSISESILLVETNGSVLVANEMSARWLNFQVEALAGENLFRLLTPFGIPIREWVYETINKKTIFDYNTSFGDRFLHIRLIPVSEGGKIRRLIVTAQDITEHKRAEEQVRDFTEQMERKVRARTQELEALNQKLTESQEQLRGLSRQLVQIQEEQFSRLAEELHDRFGQDMTAININLNILRTLLPEDVSEGVLTRLADMEKLVIESVKRMRLTMSELHPPMLDKYGLAAALRWYGEEYYRRTEIEVRIKDQYMKDLRLPVETELALFRIVQEALTNVAKHARATRIDIELLEENENTVMAITDNGQGFDPKIHNDLGVQHWGVPLMQERARAINADFLLRSVPGRGTQIVVLVRKST
jgi:signal transduction histidine kinase